MPIRRSGIIRGKNKWPRNLPPIYMRLTVVSIFIVQLFAAGHSPVFGQNIADSAFPRITPADFHPNSAFMDSNVSVIVLRDSGNTVLEGYVSGWRVKFTRYRRLLIRNKNGFDAAKVTLSFDPDENGPGKLWSLRANTYNHEAGKVVKTEVDTASIYLEKIDADEVKERFSFPEVREGSILEYSYTVYSSSIYTLKRWRFQGIYPCLKSVYSVTFPSAFDYVLSRHGTTAIERTVDSFKAAMNVASYLVKSMNYTFHWMMRDVPPKRDEPFIFSTEEYDPGVSFQLAAYTDLHTRRRIKVDNTWNVINDKLFKSSAFGGVMTTARHWEHKELRAIVADSASDIDKAKAVFHFVRDNFTAKGQDLFEDDERTLKEIFKSRQGTDAQINLMLTALLREEGLSADAVILSTRDNGLINAYYPLMENFNYVIVRLRLGGRTYFLDATERELGFGRLLPECYNGYARVVSKEPDSVVLKPDSVEEFKYGRVILWNNDAGDSIGGNYEVTEGYYASMEMRDKIAKSGEDAYFSAVQNSFPFPVSLSDKRLDSLKDYDHEVTVGYSMGFARGDGDHLYLNPLMSWAMNENPFSASNRTYPVEMPYTKNELYVLQMEIPKGYEVEELPKPVRVKLNETDGSYEYNLVSDGQSIRLRSRLILSRTFFQPEDYQSLRDFFALVVKKQNELIVLRKVKK
jgi:hypothetical protein